MFSTFDVKMVYVVENAECFISYEAMMSGLMSHYSYDVSIGVSIKLCCTMNSLNVTRKLFCTGMAMFTVLMSLRAGI